MSDGPLMTAVDLRLRLQLPSSTFFKFQKRGDFKKFEVRQPLGRYRYSRALVEEFLSGRSIVRIGVGSRRVQ